jgi:hypothetical protein
MTDLYSLPPEILCVGAIAVIGCLMILFALKPAWGCGGTIAIIALLVLGLTTNGLVAIGGAIVCVIVFIFVKFGMNGSNINIENIGDGNTITITK